MAQLELTDEKRICGHCGSHAPMAIVANYREKLYDTFDEGHQAFEYGDWYELLKCQGCDKVELRVHPYHQGLNEEEMSIEYKTIYPEPITIPEGLPNKVKIEYEKALKARHGDSNGYAVLLGRVLEAVMHDKKAKGKMLGEQLKDLASRNQLPSETLAFAEKLNKLRIVGAHFSVGNLTAKEIPIMEKLIRVILEYAYSAAFIIKKAEKVINKFDASKTKTDSSSATKKPIPSKMVIPVRQVVVKKVPIGNFETITVENREWMRRFREYVAKGKPIKYDVYNMPNLSSEMKVLLNKHKYKILVLEDDPDQRFLVPPDFRIQ